MHAEHDTVLPIHSLCPTPVLCQNEYLKLFDDLVGASFTTVTKFQGEPLNRVLNTRGGKILANVALCLGNGRDRPIVTVEH